MTSQRMEGWIKLHRSIMEWEWWDDLYTFKIFMHLLLTANYEDKKWRGVTIKRGQRLISVREFSKEVKLSYQKTRTSLSRLISTQEITQQTTQKYTVITICNYDNYQTLENRTNAVLTQKLTQKLTQEITQQTTQKDTLITNCNSDNYQTLENRTNAIDNAETNAIDNAETNANIRNKEINNIPKENIIINNNIKEKGFKVKKKSGFFPDLKFLPDSEWTELVTIWLEYKKDKKQSYKNQQSVELFFKKLAKLSGGEIETAKEIIEQSMANNWQGIFALRTEGGGTGGAIGRDITEEEARAIVDAGNQIYEKLWKK